MGFLSSIYHPQKPRGFNMPVRYYDKEKEARELRRKIILQEVKLERGEEIPRGEFVSDLHRKFAKNRPIRRKSSSDARRSLLIFLFLICLGVSFLVRV